MSDSHAVESIGLSIVYRSLADLAEDHKGHVSQGRMVVAWTESTPVVGTPVELRLEVPGGAAFELRGSVSRVAEGRGFAVEVSAASRPAVHELEQLVTSHAFQQALRVESPSNKNSRKVLPRRAADRGPGPARVPPAVTASSRPPPSAPSMASSYSPPPPAGEGRIPGAITGSVPSAPRSAPGPALEPPPRPEGLARVPGATTGAQRLPDNALRAPSPQAMQAMVTPGRGLPAAGPTPLPGPLPSALSARPAGTPAALPVPPVPPAATVSGRLPAASQPSLPAASVPPRAAAVDDLSLDGDEDEESGERADRYDDYDDDELYGEEDPEIAATTASDIDEPPPPTAFRTPGPGEKYVVYILKLKTVTDFAEMVPEFRTSAKVLVPSREDTAKEGDLAQLRISLPGRNIFTLWALVGRIRPTDVTLHVNPDSTAFAKALAFPRSVLGARRMTTEKPKDRGPSEVIRFEETRPKEDEKDMPVRRRISRMSMEDKINMALSGSREERMALALDGNKAIHHYLLKNARISLDEIAFIARLPTMNPDVLGKIAENPSYVQNLTVLKNLVYNPKTPVPIAIKLLDRMPRSEVLHLSKRMSMNQRLVQAAKKKIEGPSR